MRKNTSYLSSRMKVRNLPLVLFPLMASLFGAPAWAQQRIDLSGTWQSSLGECRLPGTTDENHLGTGEHPTDVTAQLTRLFPFSGKVTYTKTIQLPAEMTQGELRLYIERTKPTTLWIDGDSIGSQGHLYAPHEYILPPLKAGQHQISIRVDNSDTAVPDEVKGSHAWAESTQTNWNGILGAFFLESRPRTHINNVKVYPDVQHRQALVRVEVTAERAAKATLTLGGQTTNTSAPATLPRRTQEYKLVAGTNTLEMNLVLGDAMQLWSEFHPTLYHLDITLQGKKFTDSSTADFGMREFATQGTQFTINGLKTFLRGTHDACVFPLTAYAPTDEESWARLFRIARQYGINHYRCHSYTPTEAAFAAADKAGIYMHVELPLWGTIDSAKVDLNCFLLREAEMVLEKFGNHPSFVGLGLGNELWGDVDLMRTWLDAFRKQDNRHLYSFGSNNMLGWKGYQEGEDYFITCRMGAGEGYSTHTRSSFSFADADEGGILNNTRPNTRADYSGAISTCPIPVVSHETCQFQIYPDYRELPKYTGVLYPYNLEIFRDRLKENHLTPQIDAFHEANGKFAVACYKADMEYCFRTKGFGGFQLLDIKDYPGQGSALCGILDAFMDSKGLITPEEFQSFNAPVIPLALMDSYCWYADQIFSIDLAVSNYSESAYQAPLEWSLQGEGFHRQGRMESVQVAQGDVNTVGHLDIALGEITKPVKLTLTLKSGPYSNSYPVWVYPHEPAADAADVLVCKTLDEQAKAVLAKGGKVLLTLDQKEIEQQSVGGLFTPDYWNYAMFKTISENNNRPVSPGTMGMLMDAGHPLFKNFPTDGRSDWQWWCIARNSRPLILNGTPASYLPLVQVIDNVERNHKLGILMEFSMGGGKLLLTTTDLDTIQQYPEGLQYRNAILSYMQSADFNPQETITPQDLETLLHASIQQRDIQGVKNISDYKQQE